MEYTGASQINVQEIRHKQLDLIIAASGFEARSTAIFQNYDLKAVKKVAFAFTEKVNDLNRKKNDAFFIANEFHIINISGENSETLVSFLKDYLSGTQKESLDILVDYSCMTKVWYTSIINYFITQNHACKNISLFFSYTPASFNLPRKRASIKSAGSMIYPEPARNNPKPLALIIGLGTDPDKANYLIKKLNPQQLILMYADPAYDKKYVQTVLKKNRKLLENVEIRNLLNYPLINIEVTNEIIKNLCLILRMKFNVIIAPLGPKVFSLCSLLINATYPDIDVWRVTTSGGDPVYDRKSARDPIILLANFTCEDE